jgi:tetratricopeptide (TPR) repeat protein
LASLDRMIMTGYNYIEEGDLDRALELFLRVLELDPGNPSASCAASSISLRNNQITYAISILTSAIRSGRGNQEVFSDLARIVSFHPEEKSYVLTILQSAAIATSYLLFFLAILAGMEEESLSLDLALDSLKLSLALSPNDQDIQARLGLVYIRLGKGELGMNHIINATTIDPSRTIIRYYQAKALYLLGDFAQALEALLDYHGQTSLEDRPVDTDSLISLCYLMNNDLDSSLAFSQRALENNPLDIGNLINASNAYRCLGEIDTCIECCQGALQATWSTSVSGEAIHAFYNLMFAYGMKGFSCLDESFRISSKFWESFGLVNNLPSNYASLRKKSIKKLKVAILSVEIGEHVVSLFLESFLANYPKEQIHVDLVVGSNRFEKRAELLISYAHSCIDLNGMTLDQSRRILVEQGYDIIIETSGVTSDSKLSILAHRCAPIQCHYIGYHATTGLSTIDYIIADEDYIPSIGESQFVEKILRIEKPWIARTPPDNLPLASYQPIWPDNIVVASFNQSAKISEITLDYWAAVLVAVPKSILVVKDRFATSVRFQERVMLYLRKLGIDDSRVIFIGGIPNWEDHMRFYNAVDIVVDATPWSAATTAFDALAMGVPFIAICGKEASSRMSSSIVRAANHHGWTAQSPNEYSKIVCDLILDISFYRDNRALLQEENLKSSAFDAKRLAANLTALLLSLVSAAGEV